MMEQKVTLEDYPYNLLVGVRGKRMLELPSSLTKDVQSGITYALFTLEEAERDVLDKKYRLGLALSADQQQIEKKALKKLSFPYRWNYICYGVTGCAKKKAEIAKRKGFEQGYQEGYKAGLKAQKAELEEPGDIGVMELPIEIMALSTRVCNALRGNGCRTVCDVVTKNIASIRTMRNLGPKGINEILHVLHSYGFAHTEWELF